jgi:hypothetical protein
VKKILIILAVVFLPISVFASPFLGTDPYAPEVAVLKYTGRLDGVAFETPYGTFHSSGASVIYDLAGINLNVVHSFTELKACNAIGCSDSVSFQTPIRPNPPAHLRIL